METAQKMVSIQKQRSMEALEKIQTYAVDSPRSIAGRRTVSTTNAPDPHLVDTAAKFVQEIIDKALNEAAAKLNTDTLVRISLDHVDF